MLAVITAIGRIGGKKGVFQLVRLHHQMPDPEGSCKLTCFGQFPRLVERRRFGKGRYLIAESVNGNLEEKGRIYPP